MLAGERKKRMSAESIVGGKCFRIDRSSRNDASLLVEDRPERSSVQLSWNRRAYQIENRRHEIDELHRSEDPSSCAFAPGLLHHERHAQGPVIERRRGAGFNAIAGAYASVVAGRTG